MLELKDKEKIFIRTSRFLMRPLQASDASDTYLGWMNDKVASRFIVAASDMKGLNALEAYISEKQRRNDCLFLGIFDVETGEHVGNIKYEPICFESKEAVMGVLLGNPAYRGKNVFKEVFSASQSWLLENLSIVKITLGVDRENVAAISAYKKSGFGVCSKNSSKFSKNLQMIFEAP